MRHLKCINSMMSKGNSIINYFESGKEYEIFGEDQDTYDVLSETGNNMSFTKEVDGNGLSYKNWFVLQQFNKDIIFGKYEISKMY